MGNNTTIFPPNNTSWATTNTLVNEIAFIGDSRVSVQFTDTTYKSTTCTDLKGISLILLGTGIGITADGNGTIEYRAADKAFRWTAPSDTAGAWQIAPYAGQMYLQSGTTNKFIFVNLWQYSNLPSTDKTLTISVAGSMYIYAGATVSMASQVLSKMRFSAKPYTYGIPGITAVQHLEYIPFLSATANVKGGIDVIRIGTNDITAGTDGDTIYAAAKQLFDSRVNIGRKVIICGEPARWTTAVGTPVTAPMLTALTRLNELYRQYCLDNSTTCYYVDLFAISADPAYKDGRPSTNMLRDTVHDGDIGAREFGNAIYEAVKYFGFQTNKYPIRGKLNYFPNGTMSGTSGTAGLDTTGSIPTGLLVKSRGASGDLSVVCSCFTKTSPYATYGLQIVITPVNLTKSVEVSQTLITLASVGLVAGNVVKLALDFDVVTGNNTAVSMFTFIQFDDANASRSVYNHLSAPTTDASRCEFAEIVIPAGSTTYSVYSWIYVNNATPTTIRISDIELTKVV